MHGRSKPARPLLKSRWKRGRACAFSVDAADPNNVITGQVLPDGNVVFSLTNGKQTAMAALRERGTLAAEVAAEVEKFALIPMMPDAAEAYFCET